jgi:hypothetical protein
MDGLIKQFEAGIVGAKSEPKGVKISIELGSALAAAGLIRMRGAAAWGVYNLGFAMPFYKGTCRELLPRVSRADHCPTNNSSSRIDPSLPRTQRT